MGKKHDTQSEIQSVPPRLSERAREITEAWAATASRVRSELGTAAEADTVASIAWSIVANALDEERTSALWSHAGQRG